MISDIVKRNRSYRRFYEDHVITKDQLKGFVDLARLSASAGNIQPLKFFISNESTTNELIFPWLGWASYLKNWPGPDIGERPSGYIIILGDKQISSNYFCDHGIAAQTILLGAVELGYGGCMIASFDKKGLSYALNIPERYEMLLVIALGKPKEEVRIEVMAKDGDFKYFRDKADVHHVPKRSLEEVVIERF